MENCQQQPKDDIHNPSHSSQRQIVVAAAAVAFRLRNEFHNSVEIEGRQYLLDKCVITKLELWFVNPIA